MGFRRPDDQMVFQKNPEWTGDAGKIPLISFGRKTGVGNCPILDILDITWNSSHGIDHIPNGWVMFNGNI